MYIYRQYKHNIVKYRPIARQRLGKHISAGANRLNCRTSTAKQRISKESLLINREGVFSAWYMPRGYEGTKMTI
jgi:hypothetical protein